MTDMQVKYWDVVERQRANRANEALKKESLGIEEMQAKASKKQADVAAKRANIEKLKALLNEINLLGERASDEFDWFRGLIMPTVRDLGGGGGIASIYKIISEA